MLSAAKLVMCRGRFQRRDHWLILSRNRKSEAGRGDELEDLRCSDYVVRVRRQSGRRGWSGTASTSIKLNKLEVAQCKAGR